MYFWRINSSLNNSYPFTGSSSGVVLCDRNAPGGLEEQPFSPSLGPVSLIYSPPEAADTALYSGVQTLSLGQDAHGKNIPFQYHCTLSDVLHAIANSQRPRGSPFTLNILSCLTYLVAPPAGSGFAINVDGVMVQTGGHRHKKKKKSHKKKRRRWRKINQKKSKKNRRKRGGGRRRKKSRRRTSAGRLGLRRKNSIKKVF